jgi:hypothetical protein
MALVRFSAGLSAGRAGETLLRGTGATAGAKPEEAAAAGPMREEMRAVRDDSSSSCRC